MRETFGQAISGLRTENELPREPKRSPPSAETESGLIFDDHCDAQGSEPRREWGRKKLFLEQETAGGAENSAGCEA